MTSVVHGRAHFAVCWLSPGGIPRLSSAIDKIFPTANNPIPSGLRPRASMFYNKAITTFTTNDVGELENPSGELSLFISKLAS